MYREIRDVRQYIDESKRVPLREDKVINNKYWFPASAKGFHFVLWLYKVEINDNNSRMFIFLKISARSKETIANGGEKCFHRDNRSNDTCHNDNKIVKLERSIKITI